MDGLASMGCELSLQRAKPAWSAEVKCFGGFLEALANE